MVKKKWHVSIERSSGVSQPQLRNTGVFRGRHKMIETTYIDHMGNDLTIVNSARVSFGKKSDWIQRVYSGEPQLFIIKILN